MGIPFVMPALFGRPVLGLTMPCMGVLVFRTVVISFSRCVGSPVAGLLFEGTSSDLFCQIVYEGSPVFGSLFYLMEPVVGIEPTP